MRQFLLASLDVVDHEYDPPRMGFLHQHSLKDGLDQVLLQSFVALLVEDGIDQLDEEQCGEVREPDLVEDALNEQPGSFALEVVEQPQQHLGDLQAVLLECWLVVFGLACLLLLSARFYLACFWALC